MQKIATNCVCSNDNSDDVTFFSCTAFQSLRMCLGFGNDIVVDYALYNRFDDKILRNVG